MKEYKEIYHLVDENIFDRTRDHNVWGIEEDTDMERNYWHFSCNINQDSLP